MCFSVPRRPHRRTQSRAFNIERKDAKKLVPRIGNINISRNATFQNHVNCRSSLPKDVPRAEVFSEIYAPACTPCMFLPSWPKATSPEPWKKLFRGETDVFKCMGFLDVPFQNTFRGLMVFFNIATLPAWEGNGGLTTSGDNIFFYFFECNLSQASAYASKPQRKLCGTPPQKR